MQRASKYTYLRFQRAVLNVLTRFNFLVIKKRKFKWNFNSVLKLKKLLCISLNSLWHGIPSYAATHRLRKTVLTFNVNCYCSGNCMPIFVSIKNRRVAMLHIMPHKYSFVYVRFFKSLSNHVASHEIPVRVESLSVTH